MSKIRKKEWAVIQNDKLKPYISLAKFIAQTFGENCEVILHDLANVERSIIAIENNHVTGRDVGGHITDFALSTIYNPEYRDRDFVVNYKGSTDDGSKTFKSSTYYIRDDNGETIGLLCINYDITEWLNAKALLDNLVRFSNGSMETEPTVEPSRAGTETFTSNINDMLHSIIDRTLKETTIELSRMLMEEKKEIVHKLNENGVFTFKGAVGTVAKKLDVSEQTIYRYLREIQS